MRILWIKAGGLVPAHTGGRIRSLHILRELAKRHPVTVYTCYGEQTPDPHEELRSEFESIYCRPFKLPPKRGMREAFDFLTTLISTVPYSVSKYCRRDFAREIAGIASTGAHDILICDFAMAGELMPWSAPQPKVLFAHNVEAEIWRRHALVSDSLLWKAVSWGEYLKMKSFEALCARNSDCVIAVSEQDGEVFAKIVGAARVSVVPTGVDTQYFAPSGETAERDNSLIFTGSMDWVPNEDAMLHFISDILPLVRRVIPDVTLTIVGRDPGQRLIELAASASGITVTGRVEDVRPFIAASSLFIVPLRIGGGTRLKIFEAMAMGKAVISTTVGAEGLPVQNGRNIALADSDADFAGAVITCLKEHQYRRDLGSAARELVECKHDWARVAASFESVLQQAITGRATRVPQH